MNDYSIIILIYIHFEYVKYVKKKQTPRFGFWIKLPEISKKKLKKSFNILKASFFNKSNSSTCN